MSVIITYFVHGTTLDNENNCSTGWLPGELSRLGIKQSNELGNLTDLSTFDAVFSSDLKRAVDSANLNFKNQYSVTQDKRLRECNYGDLNGASDSLVVYEDHINNPFPNGECLKDVEKRIAEFIEYAKKECEGKTIAIVSHRAPQLAFEVLTKGVTWEEALANDWRKTKSWQPGWMYTLQ